MTFPHDRSNVKRTIYRLTGLAAVMLSLSPSAMSQESGGEGGVPGGPVSAVPLLANVIPNPAIPGGAWERRRFRIARAATPPSIDGDLSEECWRNATHAVGFFRFQGNAPVTEQTEAWITADRDTLYVAFHCLDSQPGRIRVSETQRGGDVDEDDHVMIAIDSQNTRRSTSAFYVSARGTQDEELEGGTADNITWAGDWKAAAKRTADGWTAEIAIPFRLLRYPRGAKCFGIQLFRRMARETNPTCWPYLPPEGQSWGTKNLYLHDFDGIEPPFYAPRPIYLPYVLASAGDGSSAREGIDIKYPLSTTLTGLLTAFPDFKTIEQQVTSINFSYNERFVEDRRPFFAEGAGFLPSPDLFYSRRIETVDQGIKIAGKSGLTTIGLLGAVSRQTGPDRGSLALNLARDIGQFHRVGMELVSDNREGKPSNRVGRLFGRYGWQQGKTNYQFNGFTTASWQAGRRMGGMEDLTFRINSLPGRPNYRLTYNSIAPDFINDLGLTPERDRRGFSTSIFQYNNFDRGPIEFYDFDTEFNYFRRHDGSFFKSEADIGGYIQDRRGRGINAGIERSARQQETTGPRYQDFTANIGFWWNQRTLFQGGGVSYEGGRVAGQPYRFVRLQQGFLVSLPFSLRAEYSRQDLGPEISSQMIVTGTYRIDSMRAISGRLIRQDGDNGNDAQSIGVVRGTNFYFAFSQRSRRGADIFLLLGDPNSPNTRGQVTLKLLRPY
jgi:hypothetical protein